MKTILALGTSSPVLSVALGTRTGKVRELRSRRPLQHSENLIPLIDRLLKKEKLSLEQIDAFAIDRGPGSFTGLRIGFSLLKGFLAVRKKPCYGALSLDMIAAGIDLPEGSLLGIICDARREAVYSRFYVRKKSEWLARGKPELLSFEQLKERIKKIRGRFKVPLLLRGDALIRYRAGLEQPSFPSARTLVRWFQAEDPRLTPARSPRDLLPLYFRRSEAEEKRKQRRGHGS